MSTQTSSPSYNNTRYVFTCIHIIPRTTHHQIAHPPPPPPQKKQHQIRNVCVLAHVDHGKTTLSDHLIASNGLIHPKLAGELRYMDSKEEEQARGITMKSSSISLLFVAGAATRPDGPNAVPRTQKVASGYLVNLIDSPGHVDFCSEVSTAARLSDGALVVVDAVEGVCIQTHAVLRQAWEEKVALCLVVNKIDRLILELRLTPEEAYQRLAAIVAHVNMIVSSFKSEKFISEADSVLAYEDKKINSGSGGGGTTTTDQEEENEEQHVEEEEEEEADVFSPSKGNVAFASAHDGWAFCTHQFAELYAAKLGCKASVLEKALWGEYAYQPKTKRIVKIKSSRSGLKPMFVGLALEPLWKAYSAIDYSEFYDDTEQQKKHTYTVLTKIIQGLGLQGRVPERVLAGTDGRAALRAVLRAWLPLSEAVLGMASKHLPSPVESAPERFSRLLPPRREALKGLEESRELREELDEVERAVRECDAGETAPTLVYVSKMVAVPASALPRSPGEPGPSNPNEERFLAFGRVFSGTLHAGKQVYVLPSTYNPADGGSQKQTATATSLYLMMGRGLERLTSVPAGNVLAIGGLGHAILKSATLSSTPACRPLAPLLFQSAAIVRVAVEPAHPADMPALEEGLRLLHRADPLVQVSVQENGEHVVAAAGEVHLETCVKDLRERFARIELLVSAPLVAFRETVVAPEEDQQQQHQHQQQQQHQHQQQQQQQRGGDLNSSSYNDSSTTGTSAHNKIIEVSTPSGAVTLRVRASPLPASIASALDLHTDVLRTALVSGDRQRSTLVKEGNNKEGNKEDRESGQNITIVGQRLSSLIDDLPQHGSALRQHVRRVWLLGPRRYGANFLLQSNGSLWETASKQQAVVKLVKQHNQYQQRGSGSSSQGGGHEENVVGGGSAATHQQQQHQQQQQQQQQGGSTNDHDGDGVEENTLVPLRIGTREASVRLGLAHGATTTNGNNTNIEEEQDGLSKTLQETTLSPPSSYSPALQERIQYAQHSVEAGIASGFQMATAAGPLCDEPMWGVCVEVDACLHITSSSSNDRDRDLCLSLGEDVFGPLSGQVTSATRAALRKAVLESGPRLVEAAFLCEVATSSEGLSAVYAVLGRRRARVLREEMREGSDVFTIHAYLPAEASFGFADELRRRSSGAAAASLMLSHWERLDVDPFFVPQTEEEREEFGEEGQGVGAPNLAKRLIDSVRKRKGLAVEKKVVESATRQRTLARKV